MKNLNLLNRLLSYSHEKQSPQRFGRYAVMLIMLLTLGVGQMWAGTKRVYCQVTNGDWKDAGAKVNVHYWGGSSAGTTWPGTSMTASGTANVYYKDIPDNATFCFARVNGSNSSDYWSHKTSDLSFPDSPASGLNLYEITGKGEPSDGQWANIGFEGSGNDIKYYYSGNGADQTWDISSASGASATRDLGTITSLYLKGWDMKMYQNMDAAIVDGTTNKWLYYNVHRSAVSPGDYSSKTLDSWTWPDWSDGYRKPYGSKSCDENLLAGLGSGIYSMTFYLQHNGLINFYLNNGGSNYNLKWTIGVPAMATHVVTSDGTGSGTDGSPFNMAVGSTLTITVSGTQASSDANSVLYVSFDNGSTYSATTTKSISIANTTKSYVQIKAKYYNSADDLSGTVYDFGKVYYQGTLTPSLAISSFTQDESTVTAANSGSTVTINASRQNAGSATITYAYSTDNSNWTTIASTTSTTQSWTLPAVTSTTTYYVKASMTYESTGYSDTENFKVYGKKTIKVKNTNGWYPFYMHRWNGDISGTSFPGEDDQISDYGSGQWKQVVLYSSNNNFIFVDGTNTDNKNSDQTYAGVTDGACYEIASGTGVLALNSTLNCPAKPSLTTTSTPSANNYTTATIAGNISSNGNDNITDYGFYWGTSSTPGTKAQKGTSNYTGDITLDLSSLTPGQTYYYRAYATNGQGTTYGTTYSFKSPYKVTVNKGTGCTSITNEGTNYTNSTITVTATKTTGYTFSSWSTTNGTQTSTSSEGNTNTLVFTPSADNATITPTYTENSYAVNVTAGSNGDVSPKGSSTMIKQVTGTTLTASPNTDYVLDYWDISGGGITPTTSTTSPQVFKATTTGGSIQAVFADQWCLKGNQWSTWTESKGLPNTATNTYSASFTLNKGTTYLFKVHNRANDTWYGNSKDGGLLTITRANSGSAIQLYTGGGNDDNVKIAPDVTGDYTFSFNTSTNKITVTYPTAYTVTFGAGTINGSDAAITASATPSFSSGDYVLPETDITFSKGSTKDGYTWKGWYSDQAGSATKHSSTDGDFTWSDTRTGNISVYACYNFITYSITYNLNGGSNPVSPAPASSFNVETSTITLPTPTRTGYTFDGWYANSDLSTGSVKTQIAKGTHENQEFWAKWTAKDYTITLNCNGATSTTGVPASVTATYDAVAAPPDGGQFADLVGHHPSRTGYTFGGWYTNNDGTGTCIITSSDFYDWGTSYVDETGHWIHDGNIEVFAKWTPNEYAVTLSTTGETGYGSNAPANQTATYGAAMPTITPPTGAAGYKFMGYFTSAGGAGTKYYNADGTSAHTWDIADATTLHAYFQKTVISSLEHPAAVAKGDVVTVDVNPVYNQSGAQDYMAICWSLLYDNDNPVESGVAVASYTEEGTKPNQVRFTLEGLSSGYYKIQAVLKADASSSFNPCSAGTELSTIKSDLRIAGNSTITIQYEDASGNTISAATSVDVARGDSIGVNAPSIVGYTFSEWVLGDVLSSACRDAATCGLNKDSINIKAEYDGVLIAQYTRKNTIYFKNTLNWPAVYVNLLNEGYWDANGSGNKDRANRNLAMTRLGESDIWYYEYGETNTSDYVSFTSQPKANVTNFWGKDTEVEDEKVKVVYPTRPNHDANERTAYGFNVNTPMFVPLAGQTAKEMNKHNSGSAFYYNQGYWAKYEPISKETGYTLKIYNKKDKSKEPDAGNAPVEVKSVPFVFDGDMTFPVSVTVDLEAGKWYGFKIYRDKGNTGDALSWYGNSGNMSNKHSGDFSKGETVWEFKSTQASNCGLQTTSAGDYVFTLAYGKEASKDSMQYLVGVHYPEAPGDYRLVYSDDNRTGILSTTIPFDSEADTLSFFVDKTASPKLALQKCEVSYDGKETTTVTWTDTIADLFSGGLPAAISESGVYYFCINRNASGKKELGDVKLYTGNFYIRTDGATPSKWDNFRQNNHLMAYSDYADEYENFTHSYTQWYDLTNRKNLKFTVANDYSVSISDTLIREDLTNISDYIDENGDLNREANVRFMYNQETNAISRAYIDGAYEAGTNFLVIESGDSKISIRNHNNTADSVISVLKFSDNGNWIYEANVKAQPGAKYKLRSVYGTTDDGKHVITQYFKGGASSTETLIGGSGSSWYQIRLLYDFKTNRVVTAYQPSGNINEDLEIHADIMFMREHQGDINEITFASGKKITDIENIYCGLRFNKWTLNNKSKEDGHATLSPLLSRYERDIFYVSFPYDVKLSDAIGFGTYGTHWIVEYYDGAARAKNGFWIDSDSYWKFVTPSMKDTFTLRAGTGYIVALDLDELYYIDKSHHASIWNNTDISDLEILFPGKVSSISDIDVTYNMPTHQCTINRGTTAGDRRIKDSHWNVLGVPTFKNITGEASGATDDGGGNAEGAIRFTNTAWIKDTMDLKFIYDGNLADNSLTPKAVKDFEFKAMHAYVVQYCGKVTFTTSATPAPASVAARTYAETPQEVDFRLELNKDGVLEDQTFVSLSNDENASADFKFGEDLSKEFNNNRANIYTFIGTEWVAGNTLPMTNQTTIVPVGVKIAADGEYTFSIPEGTYGVGITLIDNEAGARVNLGLMDYTVTLAAGQIDDRFVLEISPVHQSPTGVELLNGENGVRKVLIDNILYIVKDGVVYDAQGKRLQ